MAFLDRDGVINRKMPEGDYVKSLEEFHFLPGVLPAIRMLKEVGFLVVVVTNQRCVSRGIITEEELGAIHKKMEEEVAMAGGAIDALYFCPHGSDHGCGCRKPEPGMIFKAINDFADNGVKIDMASSFIVGDSPKDIAAGRAAGLFTVKVAGRLEEADMVSNDLHTAVRALCTYNENVSL